FEPVEAGLDEADARKEAARCLLCDEMCDLCVTVCPNMANLSYGVSLRRVELAGEDGEGAAEHFEVTQARQIINIADACNECGNCTTFCPTAGEPYRDKPRLCLDKALYAEESDGALFIEREDDGSFVMHAKLGGKEHRLVRDESGGVLYEVEAERVHFTADLEVVNGEPPISLRPALELATILEGLVTSMPYLW
ncbi:MAG: hypothetical protein JRH20_18430, partial [Deltaproteobacteria bacterium]|nr:hypothetical protein [Deltaproteobacteria bacterium]